jgi:hypothetical protein
VICDHDLCDTDRITASFDRLTGLGLAPQAPQVERGSRDAWIALMGSSPSLVVDVQYSDAQGLLMMGFEFTAPTGQ